jgi:hypothetical protein
VDQAWDRHGGVFSARVCHVVGRIPALLHARNHLPTDRAIRVLGFDEIEIVRRHSERELAASQKNPRPLLGGELQPTLQAG